MFGYDSAFIGGTITLDSFRHTFGLNDKTTTQLSSRIVSVFQAGCVVGTISAFPICEHFGRRISLIVSGFLFAVGAAIQTGTDGNLAAMYAGRVLTGVGVGGSAMVVPLYIAECAPPKIRGRCVGVFEVALQFASLCGFWVNYGVNQTLPPTSTQWRIPFAVQLIPSGLLVLSMLWAIETPRWLIKKGRYDTASTKLAWLRNLPEDHKYVQKELSDMKAQNEAEAAYGQGHSPWAAAFKQIFSRKMRCRLLLSVMMKIMQNFAG